MRNSLRLHLPDWVQEWLEVLIPLVQVVLIIVCAWLLTRLLRRMVRRATERYHLPADMKVVVNSVLRWIILLAATLLVLERIGVSASVMWAAFTGFATVGAVAFFAAWSVLSNLFCAMLIFTVGPFRVGDVIEVLDTAEKEGARGRVIDINLLYTTLEDVSPVTAGTLLQIPNTLIFQRVVRRWRTGQAVPDSTSSAVTAPPARALQAAPAAVSNTEAAAAPDIAQPAVRAPAVSGASVHTSI